MILASEALASSIEKQKMRMDNLKDEIDKVLLYIESEIKDAIEDGKTDVTICLHECDDYDVDYINLGMIKSELEVFGYQVSFENNDDYLIYVSWKHKDKQNGEKTAEESDGNNFCLLDKARADFPEFYAKYESHNGLEKEDIDLLLYQAGYDTEKVAAAIREADDQGQFANYMGWLIHYIIGQQGA